MNKRQYLNNIVVLEKQLNSIKEIYKTGTFDKEQELFGDGKENHICGDGRVKGTKTGKSEVYKTMNKFFKESYGINPKTGRKKLILIGKIV